MKSAQRSPWSAVVIGLLGLIIGYSLVIVQNGTAYAGAVHCPAQGPAPHA